MTNTAAPRRRLPSGSSAPKDWRVYVDHRDSHWLWSGPLRNVDRRPIWRNASARRPIWTELVGPIPPGHRIEVTCGHRLCVNPAHLTVVAVVRHGTQGRYASGCRCPVCKARRRADSRKFELLARARTGRLPDRVVSASAAAHHLDALAGAGVTPTEAARRAGLHPSVGPAIAAGRRPRIRRSTEAALVALPVR